MTFPRLSLATVLQPDNDNFSAAVAIQITDIVVDNSAFSSTETGESVSTSVWYSVTPAESGNYSIELTSSSAQTANIYTGSGAITQLNLLGSSDGTSNDVVFLQAGTTYWIQVASNSSGGEFQFTFITAPASVNVPLPLWSYFMLAICCLVGVRMYRRLEHRSTNIS